MSFGNDPTPRGNSAASTAVQYPYEIAISVVVYQTEPEELATLLNSLVYPKPTLVTVVDNSPTPALRATVEQAGAQYLFLDRNVGFGAGHNIALRRSLDLARYHAVVNPDVVLEPTTLSTLVAFMDEHPEIGQAMPAVLYPDGREQRLAKRLPSPADLFLRRFLGWMGSLAKAHSERYELRDLDLSVPRLVPCLSGCFMFIRSSVLKQVGFFDERYFMYMEDVDFCRRVGAVSLTAICPSARIQHGYSKGSYKNNRLMLLHMSSAVRYFFKWGWFLDPARREQNRRTNLI